MKTHQIIAVVIEVSLVKKNEIISVNVNKTKIDVFIAVILRCSRWNLIIFIRCLYTVFQKSDAKFQFTITTAYLIRIKYPLSGFNYNLSDVCRI